jgi:hypothetical protein
MSVEERTAALARVRAFRLATWVVIVPTLSFFSVSVVAGAVTFKGKPDYAGTFSQAKSLDVRTELSQVSSKVVQASNKLREPFTSPRS